MPQDLPESDEAALEAAETDGMVEESLESLPETLQTPLSEGVEDFLEETPLPTTVDNHDLSAGMEVDWGGFAFTVDGPHTAGWYWANQGETKLLVKPQVEAGLLAGLGSHRMLPRVLYSASDGTAVEAVEGEPYKEQMELPEALEVVRPLAQLVFFLEHKGLTLVDLEPGSLWMSGQGLRLLPPPRVAKIGEPAQPFWRDGHTPPEVLINAPVSAKTGVYALGALLFELLSGQPLPIEGASNLLLAGLEEAGVPQVLAQMLAEPPMRVGPKEAIALLKSLPEAKQPVLLVAAQSSIGLNPTRSYNEDAYGYRFEQVHSQWNQTLWLRACVCDGMGGMAAGEVASQAAVETFLAGSPPHPIDDPQAQADWALRLVWEANGAVLQALAGRDGGCTMSGVVFVGSRYVLGHVGDTRVYRWGPEGLTQISQDHSLVAALVASAMITPEEAENHPDKNKVLRSLGNLRQPQEHYVQSLSSTLGSPAAQLKVGELILIVSDGVWGEIGDKGIADVLAGSSEPQTICDALVKSALKAGGADNATALVIQHRA